MTTNEGDRKVEVLVFLRPLGLILYSKYFLRKNLSHHWRLASLKVSSILRNWAQRCLYVERGTEYEDEKSCVGNTEYNSARIPCLTFSISWIISMMRKDKQIQKSDKNKNDEGKTKIK